jgi:MFS family permease
MNQQPATVADEWREHWPLAISATAGMSLGPVAVYSLGLFMAPLQQAFGWSRAEVSSGMLVFAFIGTLFSPFAGAIVDRWGTRRLGLCGVVLTSFAITAFALATQSIAVWWGLWALFSLANMAVSPVIWTAAVSGVFKIGRGFALATTLCGVAISALAGPALSRWAIDSYGWRAAFVVLGLGWGGLIFVPVALFFHDARAQRRRSMSDSELRRDTATEAVASADLPGLTFREILRRPVFWRLFISQIVFITLVTAILIHMIPILTGKGLSRTTAAYVLGAYGLASIAGRRRDGRRHGDFVCRAADGCPERAGRHDRSGNARLHRRWEPCVRILYDDPIYRSPRLWKGLRRDYGQFEPRCRGGAVDRGSCL